MSRSAHLSHANVNRIKRTLHRKCENKWNIIFFCHFLCVSRCVLFVMMLINNPIKHQSEWWNLQWHRRRQWLASLFDLAICSVVWQDEICVRQHIYIYICYISNSCISDRFELGKYLSYSLAIFNQQSHREEKIKFA